VYALTVHDGELIAGGWFTTAGGTAANNIARWGGARWAPLSNGMGGNSSPHVSGLTVYGGELVAGGYLTTAGGTANNLAQWDGANWAPLGTGVGGSVPSPGCAVASVNPG
jgi:hypothetical protein